MYFYRKIKKKSLSSLNASVCRFHNEKLNVNASLQEDNRKKKRKKNVMIRTELKRQKSMNKLNK